MTAALLVVLTPGGGGVARGGGEVGVWKGAGSLHSLRCHYVYVCTTKASKLSSGKAGGGGGLRPQTLVA